MPDDESPLGGTEVYYLRSNHVGDEFKVFVGHCGAAANDTPVRVLYITDANGFFGSAVDIIRSMQLAAHLPPLLVVGIGYRCGGLAETITIRTRDLTPSVDKGFARLFPEHREMGGAPRLLAFMQTELMPWVESHYLVEPNDATYFGHSLGGLFGAWVLLTAPETFQRYGIGSPSLWWDNEVIFNYEANYAGTRDDLPAKVFFGIGADETHDGRRREAVNHEPAVREKATAWYIDMVDDMERMVKQLEGRGYPSLTMASAVFPDEFHITVPQLNLSRALRFLFDAPR
ncbi:MAG TPA: alpha/beta hydrolase-fold protein [Candidatus Margulisiibacteriota bacterium]|nr:alpha/beta hydrolase-fold protein [Candidatus Margulisiibacteriota bacterium]